LLEHHSYRLNTDSTVEALHVRNTKILTHKYINNQTVKCKLDLDLDFWAR